MYIYISKGLKEKEELRKVPQNIIKIDLNILSCYTITKNG